MKYTWTIQVWKSLRFCIMPNYYQLRSWEIMYLVASIHPLICLSVCLYVRPLAAKPLDLQPRCGQLALKTWIWVSHKVSYNSVRASWDAYLLIFLYVNMPENLKISFYWSFFYGLTFVCNIMFSQGNLIEVKYHCAEKVKRS